MFGSIRVWSSLLSGSSTRVYLRRKFLRSNTVLCLRQKLHFAHQFVPVKLHSSTRLASVMKRNFATVSAGSTGERNKQPRSGKAAGDIISIDCKPDVIEIDNASDVAVSKQVNKDKICPSDDFAAEVAQQIGLPERKVIGALNLLGAGNTLPFIARYRKENHGGLDEEQLRNIQATHEKLVELRARCQAILNSLSDQAGVLTPELRNQLEAAQSLSHLEEIYRPYRQKKKTKASAAREAGLEPLASAIQRDARGGGGAPEKMAGPFVRGSITDVQAALSGARDIIAECVTEVRQA
ncbi:hypothetical protein CYMTET_56578 [Cymbomonas tetramitiformis]|uniref:Tex-like protein N-terminal domain-containing protein n=1 Tax=Cymbomonas tetramitiformis TaxID=36881 RepID=A0AAE0ELP0_9CHLO|nr:hypothetical protein CYMTET_56578 [Cymbomonas tetramitiformis]